MTEAKPGEISFLEQEQAYLLEFATVFASYYAKLVEQGVPLETAEKSSLKWQKHYMRGEDD